MLSTFMNFPNTITLLRIFLVPLLVLALGRQAYAWALCVFLVASISDVLDGYIARRFNWRSRLGEVLDPLADKLLVVAVVLMLAWQGWLPYWLAILIVLRDVVIVSGALAYHRFIGPLEISPTYLSKANTVLQFLLLVLVLADAAAWLHVGAFLPVVYWVVFLSTLLSGFNYVWHWSHRAARDKKENVL